MALTGQVTIDRDKLLVERFLAGDSSAFDELFATHREKVYSIGLGVLGNSEDALDSVQETFTLVHKHLHRFDGRSRFSTWLYRIAVNAAIQTTRKKKSRGKTVPLTEAAGASAEMQVTVADPIIQAAMTNLAPNDRALLVLFYWEELPLQEISEVNGCSMNAAKTRLFRARERFREAYIALGGEASV